MNALLLQMPVSFRSERQLVEWVKHNLQCIWYVGFDIEYRAQRVRPANDEPFSFEGTAEREAALTMLGRIDKTKREAAVGAGKGYACKAFIKRCSKRNVAPHVESTDGYSAIGCREKRHDGDTQSLKASNRTEEAFGWIETLGCLTKTKNNGQTMLTEQALQCFATDSTGNPQTPLGAGATCKMHKTWDACTRRQNWLQTGRGGGRYRFSCASNQLACSKSTTRAFSEHLFVGLLPIGWGGYGFKIL